MIQNSRTEESKFYDPATNEFPLMSLPVRDINNNVSAQPSASSSNVPTGQNSTTLQIVMYRDRHIVVYDPETRRLGATHLSTNQEITYRHMCPVRCPMCRQYVDPNAFTFESQSYFFLLQEFLRRTRNGSLSSTNGNTADSNAPSCNPFIASGSRYYNSCYGTLPITGPQYNTSPMTSSGSTEIDNRPAASTCSAFIGHADVDSLEDTHRPRDDKGNNSFLLAGDSECYPVTKNIPSGILANGYYPRFFRELRKLGSGSFGQVFLCHHVLDDLILGEYAVKKIPVGDDRTWLQNMIREVKIREKLRNPNVVDYKHSWLEMHRSSEVCPYVPWLFVLMEFCNGGDLESVTNAKINNKPIVFSEEVIWKILIDVVLGLQHIHHHGILHRDLKLSNILLQRGYDYVLDTATGQALLADFGTAQLLSDQKNDTEFRRRGFTGTVEFTSPELLKVDDKGIFVGEYDIKGDLWSLGVILYALAYCRLPFTSEEIQGCRLNVINDVRNDKAPTAPERSTELQLLIDALLSTDPNDRPSTDDLIGHRNIRSRMADTDGLAAAGEELAGILELLENPTSAESGATDYMSAECHRRLKIANSPKCGQVCSSDLQIVKSAPASKRQRGSFRVDPGILSLPYSLYNTLLGNI